MLKRGCATVSASTSRIGRASAAVSEGCAEEVASRSDRTIDSDTTGVRTIT